MRRKTSIIVVLLSTALLFLLQGCGTLNRLAAVPAKDTIRAKIPGIPNARFWVDADLNPLILEDIKELEREDVEWAHEGHHGPLPPANYLAISGGGDDGAFG
ncbi:MAG: patatin family protein, partial [Candidatus Contendobacter sp.]|nr:patatin family protein [Candidatus Contendobacter sp.]